MKRFPLFLFLSISGLFIQSCDKAKSPKWLYANVETRNAVTGELMDANLEIHFTPKGSSYGTPLTIESVGSTKDGYLELEKKLEEEIENVTIYAYSDDKNFNPDGEKYIGEPTHISPISKNDITILLEPVYYYDLYLTNSDCHDETDSAWFIYEDPTTEDIEIELFTGCVENAKSNKTLWVRRPDYGAQIKSKRNGINNDEVYSFDLTFGETNAVYINF